MIVRYRGRVFGGGVQRRMPVRTGVEAGLFTIRAMKPLHYTRAQALPETLKQRIVILDGAMGTMIQRFKL
ncbi:MAG: hypothetical protein RL758_742, partial [Pseudomonadota bacterium]